MEKHEMLQEVLDELQKDFLNPELIQDNKLHFQDKEQKYRVKMPTQKEQSDANTHRDIKLGEFLKTKGLYRISEWKKILKENQDIDIDKIQEEADSVLKEIIQVHLSTADKKDGENESIEKLKKQRDELFLKRRLLIIQKAEWLTSTIEMKTQDEYYRYLTTLCTEVLEDEQTDKWIKVWKNYEEYENDISKLATLACGKLSELMFSV
jgi:hypothetical protein